MIDEKLNYQRNHVPLSRWWEHNWAEKIDIDMQKEHGSVSLIMDNERVCLKCGFRQYNPMLQTRATGRHWYPKTGRKCPKGKKCLDTT